MNTDPDAITSAIARTIDEWIAARAELAAIERAEHPDITDSHGRVWTWMQGGGRDAVYTHCGMAVPVGWVPSRGLPKQACLDNQNYDLCAICLNGRTRNVTPCKPEWHCSHRICQEMNA